MIDYQKYLISYKSTVRDALSRLNQLSGDILTLFVMDQNDCLIGTLTDGDIRRKLVLGIELDDAVTNVMFTNFRYIDNNVIDVDVIRRLRMANVTLLPCLDSDKKILRVYNLKKRKSILPVDAVLMAGGKGERLRPLTEKTPKPLLMVGDKPIIDYNVDNLINTGVDNIYVTVNYLSEQIENHFINPRNGVAVKCIKEPEFQGTIGSVKCILDFKNESILVMNSDLFTNIDFEDFFLNFKSEDSDIMVASIPYSLNIPYGVLTIMNEDILGIEEKPTYNHYVNAGIYLMKKEILSLIPDNRFYNATDLLKDANKAGFKVRNYPLTGYWIDIGKPEDYKKVQELAVHIQKDLI